MVKKITFKIDSEGEVNVDVEGALGNQCEDFTEDFESVLGSVKKREIKDSYYAKNTEDDNVEIESTESQ